MFVQILKKRNPPWFWRVPTSIYDLGTRQNHWKTQCFHDFPVPRWTARPLFIRKTTGCREWCCFVYYFVVSFSMTLSSNVGRNFEKAQPSMVLACSQVNIWTWSTQKPLGNRMFSWLACTTLDSQSDFHTKVDWLSRVVLFSILLCGLTFHAQIVKLQGRCCKVVAFLGLLCFNELYENEQLMRSYRK